MSRHRARRPPRRGRRAWRVLVPLATTLATVLLVAVAVNAVLSAGAGAGTAASATEVTVTLTPGAAGADLKPGGRGGVRLVATNPHEAAVAVDRLTLDTSRGSGGLTTGSAACPASALSYTAQDNTGQGWRVPARSGGTDGSLTIVLASALTMSSTAPDGCQGVSVTVFLTAQA